MNTNLNKKIINATKWSSMAEILAKLSSPIVNMILARILTPESFGVIASIAIVTSFADIFTDAGFQRYIIQHNYKNDKELDRGTNVAFWTNLGLSIFIFFIVVCFKKQIAYAIGCANDYNALLVASITIICTSFSSIYTARFRRSLDFKSLFKVKLLIAFLPIVITVPLAFIMHSHWAMVIGTVIQQISAAIMLGVFSEWKPKIQFSIMLFKQMVGFSLWNLLESLSIWFAGQAGIFIVSQILNTYYLGLYKTSMATVNSYMAIVTSSITPVLYSSLSRCQDDEFEYKKLFFKFQRYIAILMFPMGVGLLIFRRLAVTVLLGNQWMEICNFVGMWAIMSSITISFSNLACEVYRSKGKPQISLILQIIYITIYLPAILYSAKKDFDTLTMMSAFIRIIPVCLDLIVLNYYFKIKFKEIIKNVFPAVIATFVMAIFAVFFQKIFSRNIILLIFSVLICIIIYFGVLLLNKKVRNELFEINIIKKIILKMKGVMECKQ